MIRCPQRSERNWAWDRDNKKRKQQQCNMATAGFIVLFFVSPSVLYFWFCCVAMTCFFKLCSALLCCPCCNRQLLSCQIKKHGVCVFACYRYLDLSKNCCHVKKCSPFPLFAVERGRTYISKIELKSIPEFRPSFMLCGPLQILVPTNNQLDEDTHFDFDQPSN